MVTNAPVRSAPPREGVRRVESMPQYLEAVRLCLDGSSSPLDWHRLAFTDAREVARFLGVNRADLDDPFDRKRLDHLLAEAVSYVRRHFGYRIPPEVECPDRYEDLFLLASEPRLGRPQVLACVVLKLMHVLNHLEAHSLLHESAIRESEIERAVEQCLMLAAEAMMANGVPITSFVGNRKSRDSTITKLVVKRDITAGEILDRVRFCMITDGEDDIVPALAHLLRHVLPFNHVLARESVNTLVDLDHWLSDQRGLRSLYMSVPTSGDSRAQRVNEFSSDGYRAVNFAVEVPVRLDRLASQADRSFEPAQGRVVYVQAELQVMDSETARNNDLGDNSHQQYKLRQRRAAERRLSGQIDGHDDGSRNDLVKGR